MIDSWLTVRVVCLCVCVWAGAGRQQYVGGQPVMQLQLAQQQAGAQELYANGYADAAAAASSSAKQMAPPRQSSSDYRYPETLPLLLRQCFDVDGWATETVSRGPIYKESFKQNLGNS